MKNTNSMKNKVLMGMAAALSAWAMSGCLGTDQGGDGLAVSVKDSVSFAFHITAADSATGGDSLDVASIRHNLHDKADVEDSTIQFTDIAVTFDDSTRATVIANAIKGTKFVLKVYYQNLAAPGSSRLLALGTDTATALAFDSAHVVYELNKNLFGVLAGFHALTSAVRDTTVAKIGVFATIDFVGTPAPGTLKANCILTAQAKVKP